VTPDGSDGPDGAAPPEGSVLLPDGALADAREEGLPPPPPPVGDGHVTFRQSDGRWFRIAGKESASPEDLTSGLDALSTGSDGFLTLSKDGDWLATIGSRFSCASGSCLDEFTGDVTKGGPIAGGAGPIAASQGRPAVASGGNVMVFPGRGPHSVDLFAVRRSGATWGAPVLLTADSTFSFHHDVAIAFDGSRILCDCGEENYGIAPTSICEVRTDGTGFHVVVNPDDGPDHTTSHAPHHADYTPEGDYVFEADWPSEQVWKLARGAQAPVKISPDTETDDNSPCVLPDGRIASLWLGRQGNPSGLHELKVMNPDGSGSKMLLIGTDIVDIGIGCGN